MKKLLVAVVIIISICGIGVFAAYSWYKNQIDTPNSDSASIVEVEIEAGESVKEIAQKLQAAGLIKSADVFYFYVKFEDKASSLQAGKFRLPQNLTIKQVADSLQNSSGNTMWITIREGLRYDEIANELDSFFLQEENTNFNREIFIDICENPQEYDLEVDILKFKPEGNSLEGFIFPDTYNVKKDIDTIELMNILLNTLESKLENNNANLEAHNELSPYEVLILASIIEREARNTEQRYMVSDILQSRLRGDMDGVRLLQADATLLYELKDWKAVITRELKETDSPYNTYKNVGLPPTPICNTGLDSIKAVLDPKENDYFFYLHDNEGQIHYAKTLEEHTNNQRCYINNNPDYCL